METSPEDFPGFLNTPVLILMFRTNLQAGPKVALFRSLFGDARMSFRFAGRGKEWKVRLFTGLRE